MPLQMTDDIIRYWTGRAESYSGLNREELKEKKDDLWLSAMMDAFPEKGKGDVRILDIGCGPGYFSIILARAGFRPDAADCTPEMLKQARQNAGPLADRIRFHEMNADHLEFEDNTFDVVLSRNLTWNLEDPCVCYTEWKRVLRPGGKVLIFDANWYAYLFDESVRSRYDQDRENVARQKLKDFNIGENFDVMERIAESLPMSRKDRPYWDVRRMLELGYRSAEADGDIWKNVWSEEEKVNYTATPMFRILAEK